MTTIPYLLGYVTQGENWRFSGFLFAVEDGNSYLAKMHNGLSGEWLFSSPYSPPSSSGIVAFIPYILIGKAAILSVDPHLQLMILFQIFRLISICAMILATYHFVAMYFTQSRWIKWVMAVVLLGGGLGWIMFLFPASPWRGWMPLSFISPESFAFLSLFGLPHLAMARALLLGGWVFYVREKTIAGSLKASGLWILMAVFQPLSLLVVWAVLLSFSIITLLFSSFQTGWAWKKTQEILFRTGLPVACSAPIVAYYFLMYRSHPYVSAWKSQSLVLTPGVDKYLLAYGLLVPFVVITLRKVFLLSNLENRLLIAWGIAFPVLISFPFNFQRRMAEGIWVVVVILAFLGVSRNKRKMVYHWRWIFGSLFITPVILVGGSAVNVLHPASPLYQTAPAVEAFKAVRKNVKPNDVVISAHDTGNPLPAYAPVHVVLGHHAESVPYQKVLADVEKVYQLETPQDAREQIIAHYDVDYIFWGPHEQALGGWVPDQRQGYKLLYKEGKYHVFKVAFAYGE